MKRKRWLASMLVLVLCLTMLPATAMAAEVGTYTGFCGAKGTESSVRWTLTPTGEMGTSRHRGAYDDDSTTYPLFQLTISGNGAMCNYDTLDYPPYLYDASGSGAEFQDQISSIVIEDGITHIGEFAFSPEYFIAIQENVEWVYIPTSVKTIGEGAFIHFYPTFGGKLKDIYYGGTKEQWNDIKIPSILCQIVDAYEMEQITGLEGATIHYNAEIPEQNAKDITSSDVGGENETILPPCALSELTSIDYLAFADLAYMGSPQKGTTVMDMLGDKWKKVWSNDITYGELYEHIQGWKYDTSIANSVNGFYAMAFVNDRNEYMITYRGSVGLDTVTNDPDAWWADWIDNNGEMLLNSNGAQVILALRFYDIVKELNPAAIGITGHSLGGALGDIVSAYSGDKAITFNAAPFLDIAYACYPERMSEQFAGTDLWKFVDSINEKDIVGMMDSIIKPRAVYADGGYSDSAHSLKSFVYKDSTGSLQFLSGVNYSVGKTTWIMPEASLTNHKQFLYKGKYIDFGTSRDDVFYGLYGADSLFDVIYEGLSGVYSRCSYGGDGSDEIIAGLWSDTLVGGEGTDFLSGNTGDDLYIYNKGDGTDYIIDRGGDDCIHLRGFSDTDRISAKTTKDSKYIDIYCNDDVIIRINKSCRDRWNLDNFSLKVEKGDTYTTEYLEASLFTPKNYANRMIIACPVKIQILDENGKCVYTVEDVQVGANYTEYGDFYVYEQENGEYSKVIDLIEGYSVKIIGTDSGTMDVAVSSIDGNTISTSYVTEDTVITNSTIATIEMNETAVQLKVDGNGDGKTDKTIELEAVAQNAFSDVSASAYYYDAVQWAVRNGITNGTTDTTFSPEPPCTRAQMATFLWRAAGCPTPTSGTNPFTDVNSSAYYYEAVLWAVENGITNGTSETTFAPNAICTRAQMVTFLWRFADCPAPTSSSTPFTDVGNDTYYGEAVLWAVEKGITNGTGTDTFSPDADCTRGQIVTFLYRFLG